jgi:hypothetical protein
MQRRLWRGRLGAILLRRIAPYAEDATRANASFYEIDGPHELVSPEWAAEVEAGHWPTEVRPFTRNCRLALYKVR